jgi:predicted RNase H-like HicB family nuclease
MRVAAIVSRDGERWLAQCEEVDRAGEGRTADEAIACLREALEEYFGHAEAVAPPAQPPRESIEIVVVDAPAGTELRERAIRS